MNKLMEILTLLACLMLIAPAICAEINIDGGSDSMVSSPNGVVSGGDFVTTDVSTPSELGFTVLVRAHAALPEGVKGFAFSHKTRTRDLPMTLMAPNGNGYALDARVSGTVNADVRKTSSMGTAVSDAEIMAHAHANADTNQLDGSANISASTSNTGTGTTRALATGIASYDVKQTVSSSGSTPVKEVYGVVNGRVDLSSVNHERNIISIGSGNMIIGQGAPQGRVSGSGYISTMSLVNDNSGMSNGNISTKLVAQRLSSAGTSKISAVATGSAVSGGWDGGSPANMTKIRGVNDSVLTKTAGTLRGMADAYAPGDIAMESGRLRSESVIVRIGDGFNNATTSANTSVSVVRTETGFFGPRVHAESRISGGSLNATSRDNTVFPAATFGVASANKINMDSRISAKNAWSGDNSISAVMQGLYDARFNTTLPEIYLANISNKIVNHGPPMTGSISDISSAEEHIFGQHAEGADFSDISTVNVANKNILNRITGRSSVAGGQTVLGPISVPTFDTTPVAIHTVTGPTAMPSNTATQNSNIISYNATSFFLRAPG